MPTDTSFEKRLKKIDEDLSLKWNDKVKRWEIFHKDRKNISYMIMRVQYKDGSFKPLDERIINAIKYSNYLRHQSPQDILYLIDRENEMLELQKQNKLSSDIEAITKDSWRKYLGVPQFSLGGLR